ncbi:MAG: MBL fold metallo-hydrolase, partial [Candidatus Puniceispirillum sp.]
GEQVEKNIHVGGGISEDSFVEMREARDATLAMPKLIMPSIQVNMRAGNMPPSEGDGEVYLKVPIKGFRD